MTLYASRIAGAQGTKRYGPVALVEVVCFALIEGFECRAAFLEQQISRRQFLRVRNVCDVGRSLNGMAGRGEAADGDLHVTPGQEQGYLVALLLQLIHDGLFGGVLRAERPDAVVLLGQNAGHAEGFPIEESFVDAVVQLGDFVWG